MHDGITGQDGLGLRYQKYRIDAIGDEQPLRQKGETMRLLAAVLVVVLVELLYAACVEEARALWTYAFAHALEIGIGITVFGSLSYWAQTAKSPGMARLAWFTLGMAVCFTAFYLVLLIESERRSITIRQLLAPIPIDNRP